METLFVYGTLCFSEIIEKLTGKSFRSEKAVLKGYQRRKVKGADYPAIVVDSQSEVEGIAINNVDLNSMRIITFYESEDYRIDKVSVVSNEELIVANVFVWDSEINELENEDWNPESFIKDSLSDYLEKVIPETILEFNQN